MAFMDLDKILGGFEGRLSAHLVVFEICKLLHVLETIWRDPHTLDACHSSKLSSSCWLELGRKLNRPHAARIRFFKGAGLL